MKRGFKKLCLAGVFLFSFSFANLAKVAAIQIAQTNPADILRPYKFGFGSSADADEGVAALVEKGNLQHLSFTDSTGHTIRYWVHMPTKDDGSPIENLPLVLYMHGYSDGGSDNDIVLRYHNAILYRLIQQQDNPDRQAVILIPQTPNGMNEPGETDYFKDQWVGIKGNDKWSQWNLETWNMDETPRTKNLDAVVELLKETQKVTKSDVDRTYVTGISMGGYTTWDLISRDYNHIFAAAIPICGVGDPNKIANAADLPIRMYHGTKDTTINVASSRRMYRELRKYGNVSYVEYDAEAHPVWNSAYSPVLDDDQNGISNLDDTIDWLFNQSRKGTLNGKTDILPLTSIIWDARQEQAADYPEDVWLLLQANIAEATNLLNPDSDPQEVKAMVQRLDHIITTKTGITVSKDVLNTIIQTAEQAVNRAEAYQQDTAWEAMIEALHEATAVNENSSTTQAEVDAAATKLAELYGNIRLIPNEEILEQLKDFIDQVASLPRENYHEEELAFLDQVSAKSIKLLHAGQFSDEEYLVLFDQITSSKQMIREHKTDVITPEDKPKQEQDKKDEQAGPATADTSNLLEVLGTLAVSGAALLFMHKSKQNATPYS